MIWIILFILLGVCFASITYFIFTKSPYIYFIIVEIFAAAGILLATFYPVNLDTCKEKTFSYKLTDISNDYELENRTYVFGQYNPKTKSYDYKFLAENAKSPHYGTIELRIDKDYTSPIIEVYTYEKNNSFWTFKSTDELTHSKIYISPKDIYYEEKD